MATSNIHDLRTYYIYKLTNPLTDEPYYVGCTVSIQRRKSAHECFTRSHHCAEKIAIEAEIQGARLKPQFEVIDQLIADDAQLPLALEKYWALKLQHQGYCIVGINPTVRIVRHGLADIEGGIREIKLRAAHPNRAVNIGVHLGED